MGNRCLSNEEPKKAFPDFYYLCREKRYLLRISNDKISKHKFDNTIKIRQDSGIGYLNDGRIMIGGGTDNAGCLTTKAYIINPATKKVTCISNLPIASKEGSFFQYKNYVYYVGGIKENEDEDILLQEESTPIMKYYLNHGYWEVFDHRAEREFSYQYYLKNSIRVEEDESDEEKELSLKEILYAGMFMIKSKIYFINGQRISSHGILKSMNLVFSIDLEEDDFNFKQENFESPLKVFRPVCGSYDNRAFITGGLDPTDKKTSMKTYIISFENTEPEFIPVDGLRLPVHDWYPIISAGESYIAISYPNVAIYENSNNNWLMFKFSENLVNRNRVEKATPVLGTECFLSENVVNTDANFKTKYQKFEKTSQSEGPDSGMSLSEPERQSSRLSSKLPQGIILQDHSSKFSSVNKEEDSSEDFSVEEKIEIPKLRSDDDEMRIIYHSDTD